MEAVLGDIDNAEELDKNEIQSKLSKMSFEDLQKLKAELGTKVYHEAYFGVKKVKQTTFKRASKNRPREVSSKIKPKLEIKKPKVHQMRDPRFDSLAGTFDKTTFEKNYSFINDIRKQEKEKLTKMLKSEKDESEVSKIKYLLQRMNNQDRERMRRENEQAKRDEERRELILTLKSGQKPHYKTKFEKKVSNIVDKYKELKESGRLMKYMEKKQKKKNFKERQKRYFEHDFLET